MMNCTTRGSRVSGFQGFRVSGRVKGAVGVQETLCARHDLKVFALARIEASKANTAGKPVVTASIPRTQR